MKYLLIHEVLHVVIYFVGASLLYIFYSYLFTKKNLLLGLVVTILLDLDHLIDYFLYNGLFFNLSGFISGAYFDESLKTYVFFHAWEYIFVLVALFLLKRKKTTSWLIFIALGMAAHLVFDTTAYSFSPKVYSVFYRYMNNFSNNIF